MIFRMTPAQKIARHATRLRFTQRGRLREKGGIDLPLGVNSVVIFNIHILALTPPPTASRKQIRRAFFGMMAVAPRAASQGLVD